MDLTTITVQNFKNQFPRDFPYLPTWLSASTYNEDDEVYYEINNLFYRCLNDGVTTVPTDVTDWVSFSDDIYNYILDSDIETAFIQAQVSFNQALFGTDQFIQMAYLYVTAHYLVIDMQNAIQGIEGKGFNTVNSRSVGSVSEGYAIPEAFLKNPIFNPYSKTGYGLKYLQLVLPKITGNVKSVDGATRP